MKRSEEFIRQKGELVFRRRFKLRDSTIMRLVRFLFDSIVWSDQTRRSATCNHHAFLFFLPPMMRGAVGLAVEPRAPLVAEGRSLGLVEPDIPAPRPDLLAKWWLWDSSRLRLVCPLDPLLPILPLPVWLEERGKRD